MSTIKNITSTSSLLIPVFEPSISSPDSSDSRIDAYKKKTLETQYLDTYKALALGGRETLESRIIRLAATPHSPISSLSSLPKELARKIFSYSDKPGMAGTSFLNQEMKSRAIDEANYSERASIKSFIEILTKRLNVPGRFQLQRLQLGQISERIVPLNFTNLRDLKGYILGVKTELINVLKTLDLETATGLFDNRRTQPSYIQLPNFMEDIFVLAEIGRKLNEANERYNDDLDRGLIYQAIGRQLAHEGNIHVAMIVESTMIRNERLKGYFLLGIVLDSSSHGNFDQASNLATSIIDEELRGRALTAISQDLTSAGNIPRAIAIANLIPNEDDKWFQLSDISEQLAQAGNFRPAILVARSIPDSGYRATALAAISDALRISGNLEKAIAIARLIPDLELKGMVLVKISKSLKEVTDVRKAIAIARSIPDELIRGYALRNISKRLIKAGDFDTATTVAKSIPDKSERGHALRDISKALVKAGDVVTATSVARSIPDELIRGYALQYISGTL